MPIGVIGAIGEGIADVVAAVGTAFAGAGAGIAGAVGLGDATLGGITAGSLIGGGLEGATVGGVLGGVEDAVTGKPILPGILEGGLTGAAVGGLGPAIGGLTGLGATAGDVLAGAGAGALGGAVIPGAGTPLQGAIGGGVSGLVSGALSGAGTGSASTGGPGASAAGIAAPPGVGDIPGDLPTPPIPPSLDATGNPISTSAPSFGGSPGGGDIYGGGGAAAGATTGTGLTTLASPAVGASQGLDIASYGSPVPGGTTLGDSPSQGAFGAYTTPDTVGTSLPATGTPIGSNVLPADLPSNVSLTTPSAGFLSNTFGGSDTAYGSSATTAGPSGGSVANPTYATSPAAGATTGNSISNFIDNPSLSTLGAAASNNSGLLLGGGLLGLDVLRGNQVPKGENAIAGEAQQLGAQSTQLENYLTSGTLPPGVSTALTQAASSAKAAIRSQYAARGMSGSSAEAQDLANVDNTIVSQGASIATNLLNTGVSEANLAAQLYGQILQTSLAQDNQLSGALATLASAAAVSSQPRIVLGTTSG